ncbi:hypothetical protein [Candidatus Nitrosocosmicus franklandus]|uniref:C2H2-type domain-containing protein n=1 Tax=Candidatus Nitrosocosmicus franklandianus TaxID=1798806 RepID=A0A484IFE1_9ARCH|nr:hypothetical protein [Candidatus Nitrosocosmicus franklandus]VFJ14342.1 conserved protein of unknown function [Candidatus Nitrosocosmicus franklandus]
MSSINENETESSAIIKEIIPGKNNDFNEKSISQNDNSNNNNPIPSIQRYDEQESAQAVTEFLDEKEKLMNKSTNEAEDHTPNSNQATINNTRKVMNHASKDTRESHLEIQKQFPDPFQSIFTPYFQNTQNQFKNNQDYFNNILELYGKIVNNYVESALAFNTIFNEAVSSSMNSWRNAFDTSSSSSSINRRGSFKVDSGRNSDENSTDVKATFSCETCGQIFDSRQNLKEHTSITHYK